MRVVAGPHLDDLEIGRHFDDAPALTLTAGHAAVHQAILGDRLRLPLDRALAERVTGEPGTLAHPGLVWDVAIGQSTVATQRVRANLFYRGLAFHRAVRIGDTLRTVTTVEARKRNRSDPAAGLAVLRIRTTDQDDRPVLDFHRCAMLPIREPDAVGADDLPDIPADLAHAGASIRGWDLSPFGESVVAEGDVFALAHHDVVSGATELARLTLNVAAAHHDAEPRLVYGGHAIGLACAQLCRALPDLVTVVAWHGCDHLGPVHEGDRLRSRITVERREGHLVHLRIAVTNGDGDDVLAWRPIGVIA